MGGTNLPLGKQIGPVWQSVGLGEAPGPGLPELPRVEDVTGTVLRSPGLFSSFLRWEDLFLLGALWPLEYSRPQFPQLPKE